MRQALTLGSISASAIAVAFLQQWYVLVVIGPGRQTDALFAGMAIPQLILAVVSGSLVHVIVPLLAAEETEKARSDAWVLLTAVSTLFAAVAAVLIVSASLWAPLLFPGFGSDAAALLVSLVRIQLVGMIGIAAAGVISAWLHSRRRFVRAELSQLAAAVLTFAALIWALPRFGITSAAWLAAARAILVVALLLPLLGLPTLSPNSARGVLREAWRRIRPLLVGNTYFKTDPVVDRFLASMAPPGQLSLLHLAQQLFNAAAQVVHTALTAPVVPLLAADAAAGRWLAFQTAVRRRTALILALTAAFYAVLIFAGRPLLMLLIGRGGVTADNVHFLWILLLALGGVLTAGAAAGVTSAAFYARGDTRTPTLLGMVTYTIYVPLKIVAFVKWGVIALAVATSLFAIVNFVLQFVLLERRGLQPRSSENELDNEAV
jgi:putative peptidoglycan lipid II flippase